MAIFTGSTLHEVAHVVGAGNAMDPDGALHLADQATITKMIRVMMLAPVLLIMSFDKFKQAGAKPFVLAFVLYVWLLGGGYLMAKYLSPYLQ